MLFTVSLLRTKLSFSLFISLFLVFIKKNKSKKQNKNKNQNQNQNQNLENENENQLDRPSCFAVGAIWQKHPAHLFVLLASL